MSEVCKEFAIGKEALIKKGIKKIKQGNGLSISPEIIAALHVKRLVCILAMCPVRQYNGL